MKPISCLLAAMAALAACSFSPAQEVDLESAISRQSEALVDARFAEIMRELEARSEIEWRDRLDATAQAEAAAYPSPTEWLLARFAAEGGLSRAQLRAWRKWNPFSSTTASTTPHLVTRLNLWNLSTDRFTLANTLTHERTHFFGVVHPRSQRRAANMCDPAYVAGGLAEALLASRSGSPRRRAKHICPALCAALVRRGLWSPCAS